MTAVGALLTMAALGWMVSAALGEAWRLAHRGRPSDFGRSAPVPDAGRR